MSNWLRAGVRLGWVVNPVRRRVTVYRESGEESLLDHTGVLDGEDVLPGFSVPVSEVC